MYSKPAATATRQSERGMILVAVLSITVFLGVIFVGVFSLTTSNLIRSRGRVFTLEAQYAAESGVDAAIAMLNNGSPGYAGTAGAVTVLSTTNYKATYTSTVASGSSGTTKVITAVGSVYAPAAATKATVTRKIKVTVQQSSTTSASSVVSQNILALDSGIKNLYAKDINVNGFITMAKSTTNLVAENITVAGKNTGATNCSIGGSGNLVKPSSFTAPGQTKTNITVAYNNCISPPGNTSNSNFNVSSNQNNISSVISTYIPWSQFMDGTYTNAGSCSDWTTGTSPRSIPSVANSKKTHYPDSSSNVSTSCGTSGDLNLGSSQYNITDNVHIRANLCAASGCTPTFYNPSTTVHYIFVEGSVNFSSVQTAAGSGPLVIIAYGADPSSKTSTCPYGGAVYVGNTGTTSAPALFLMAENGLCLDKTKFSSSPAMGGVGGKNIYIATNAGSPFDLAMNTSFPVTSIPVNLSWRALYYQRL
jgi:Tfp pilus assembly protein PilX